MPVKGSFWKFFHPEWLWNGFCVVSFISFMIENVSLGASPEGNWTCSPRAEEARPEGQPLSRQSAQVRPPVPWVERLFTGGKKF